MQRRTDKSVLGGDERVLWGLIWLKNDDNISLYNDTDSCLDIEA